MGYLFMEAIHKIGYTDIPQPEQPEGRSSRGSATPQHERQNTVTIQEVFQAKTLYNFRRGWLI